MAKEAVYELPVSPEMTMEVIPLSEALPLTLLAVMPPAVGTSFQKRSDVLKH